jgi:hypothetical protein
MFGKTFAALAVTTLALGDGTALAQQPRALKLALQAGVTAGGDRLATLYFTNGEEQDIRAGNLLQFGGGLAWEPLDLPITITATANYHIDDSTASNSDTRFRRYPVELLAYYTGVPNFRFGAGLRIVTSPEFKADFGAVRSVKFDNATGAVAEIGYRVAPAIWFTGRLVTEKYTVKSINGVAATGPDTDGDHLGLFVQFQF